eukprot:NODE_5179_length_606_cov_227.152450.p4 GENE.NODE_5179_length_606_cov_227.152450~~NODE_5179_length_606_cov_227.152450.p4  ORF type:complete len:59 (+),score=10.94 NODE_5179_length_606_cov_227.152450:18-194(+)
MGWTLWIDDPSNPVPIITLYSLTVALALGYWLWCRWRLSAQAQWARGADPPDYSLDKD